MTRPSIPEVAQILAELYEKPFGGKPTGRYRISPKMLRKIANRTRLPDSFIRDLSDELFELGFVFLDMETFYAVASGRTFVSYRRLGEASFDGVEQKKQTQH